MYDFVLSNELPFSAPERFQAFYARASRLDFVIRRRHAFGWLIAGCIGFKLAQRRYEERARWTASINFVPVANVPSQPAKRSGQ